MNYQLFTETMRKKVQELLEQEIKVELHQVTKNNGITLSGLCIIQPGIRIMPTIYLEEFYRKYKNGSKLEFLAREVIDVYERSRKSADFSVDYFSDFSKVQDQIIFKLVNLEKNKELLKDVPHFIYMDLAGVFVLSIENPLLGSGNVLIHSEHLRLWNITEEVLYEYARENTLKIRPVKLQKIRDLIKEMSGKEEPCAAEEVPMYVLSNNERIFGAAVMIYDRILYKAGEELGDNYYILPSSIHELILVPEKAVENTDFMEWMVREINATEVDPEEVLSDHIYLYDREHHRLKDFTLKIDI